jgi:carbamoyl-phosphate synthase large subunit
VCSRYILENANFDFFGLANGKIISKILYNIALTSLKLTANRISIKKVLLLGSGALKIGEAGEFDYSGSQAIKALKEEGIEVILVNPNIATNQTGKDLADKVYFLPVNPYFVEKVIAEERPEGILLSFGGQTALNCGVALENSGVLAKYDVKVLGTPVKSIEKTEDRDLFNKELQKLGVSVPRSIACNSKEEGLKAAETIGFPLMIRAAFALGGKGSGFAYNMDELNEMLNTAFAFSPQVLVEENLKGWKEIEYEVVRDAADNCITVCNMENFDPLGIHTGESIVIAPSQTLDNTEYHMLRDIAIKVIRSLGIVGECNIQYALDPVSRDYRVIEVNARLSRSSALASKATGYPLAFVAAKLALGYRLFEIKNAITQETSAYFEPALDYVALKIPRWDLNKFHRVSNYISSEMKSVGEVMALGRSFEEVMQKGMRMLQVGFHGFTGNKMLFLEEAEIEHQLANPTPRRLLAIYEAFKRNFSTEKISQLTGIDLWFLEKLKNIVNQELSINERGINTAEEFLEAKKLGFSDKQIGDLVNQSELEIRAKRISLGVKPIVRQIDTLAAEYPAKTNYLYMTYHGQKNDIPDETGKPKAIVMGSGPYCIGSSVEFDWCCVTAITTLAREGYETIMINYNPETVSTDYDTCDKLYFEELSLERVLDIYEQEQPEGLVVSMGGQIPNNIATKLENYGVKIIGTKAQDIDRAESRHTFSSLLDEIGVKQPAWQELTSREAAKEFSEAVGYPVLVRPSYVLSGAAMRVAHNEDELLTYLDAACGVATDSSVVVSKFEQGAKEIEIDAVAHDGEIVIYAISEHIENAGVHSGDATIVLPPQKLYLPTIQKIKNAAKAIAKNLNITGPFNIQFLAKNNEIKVIECNLRASRSFPFVSKVTGYNFIEIATSCMIGKPPAPEARNYQTVTLDYVACKAPQFSFSRLKGADPVLGVEMASTGEVACFGKDVYEAFLKSLIAVGLKLPEKNILLSIGSTEDKASFLPAAKALSEQGFSLWATPGTADFLEANGLSVQKVHKNDETGEENILDVILGRKVDLVINIPKKYTTEEITDGYKIRRAAIDANISLITNLQVAEMLTEALARYDLDSLPIDPWSNYENK